MDWATTSTPFPHVSTAEFLALEHRFRLERTPRSEQAPSSLPSHRTASIRSHFAWNTNTMFCTHHSNRFVYGETQSSLPSLKMHRKCETPVT